MVSRWQIHLSFFFGNGPATTGYPTEITKRYNHSNPRKADELYCLGTAIHIHNQNRPFPFPPNKEGYILLVNFLEKLLKKKRSFWVKKAKLVWGKGYNLEQAIRKDLPLSGIIHTLVRRGFTGDNEVRDKPLKKSYWAIKCTIAPLTYKVVFLNREEAKQAYKRFAIYQVCTIVKHKRNGK